MDKEAKKQYMDTLREKYFKGTKKEKGVILSEYCGNTLIVLLNKKTLLLLGK